MNMLSRIALASAFALVAGLAPAAAHDYTLGPLKIIHPWARETPKGAAVGGGYLKITNTGTTPDTLVGGSTSVAAQFEIHEMSMDNGVMKMRPVGGGLEIKAGQTVTLAPGGYHIMLVGLKEPLKKGEKVKATLQFAKAGKVDVEFMVEGMGATSAEPANDMPGMKHDMPGMKMPGH